MADFKNPAARLLGVFERLSSTGSNSVSQPKLAKLLDYGERQVDPFEIVLDIRREFDELSSLVDSLEDEAPSQKLLLKQLPKIETCVRSLAIGVSGGGLGGGAATTREITLSWQISDSAITALEFMAVQLPASGEVLRDDLESLREHIEALREEVMSASLPPEIRGWLLELVRLMRDAVDRSLIRGANGVRQQLAQAVGEVVMAQEQ